MRRYAARARSCPSGSRSCGRSIGSSRRRVLMNSAGGGFSPPIWRWRGMFRRFGAPRRKIGWRRSWFWINCRATSIAPRLWPSRPTVWPSMRPSAPSPRALISPSLSDRRFFFYMPFEHSEDIDDQILSVKLFTELADPNYLDFAIRHHEVIRLFGRFPHRNAIMGRTSTSAEEVYLSQPDAGF